MLELHLLLILRVSCVNMASYCNLCPSTYPYTQNRTSRVRTNKLSSTRTGSSSSLLSKTLLELERRIDRPIGVLPLNGFPRPSTYDCGIRASSSSLRRTFRLWMACGEEECVTYKPNERGIVLVLHSLACHVRSSPVRPAPFPMHVVVVTMVPVVLTL